MNYFGQSHCFSNVIRFQILNLFRLLRLRLVGRYLKLAVTNTHFLKQGKSPKQSFKDSSSSVSHNDNECRTVICCKVSCKLSSLTYFSIHKSWRQVRHWKPTDILHESTFNFLRECNPWSNTSSAKTLPHAVISSLERRGNMFSPFSLNNLSRFGSFNTDNILELLHHHITPYTAIFHEYILDFSRW